MIYISPTDSFDNPFVIPECNDADSLVKVQIDNSLALGWKAEDIMLITNFEYQYGPIKAIVFKDVEFFESKPQGSKYNALIKLFENRMIKDGEMYWFHDIDAYQLAPIAETEIDISPTEIALTDYGRIERWSTGSIFFKSGSKDIFCRIKENVYKKNIDEERVLSLLTANDEAIRKRVKKINKTYNFTAYNLRSCYKMATKPIRVAHFHPYGPIRQIGVKKPLDFFKGENKIETPFITESLIKIFLSHGIS